MFCLMLARVYCEEGLCVPIYGREAPLYCPSLRFGLAVEIAGADRAVGRMSDGGTWPSDMRRRCRR